MPDGNQMGPGKPFRMRKRSHVDPATRSLEFVEVIDDPGYDVEEVKMGFPPPEGGGYKGKPNGYFNESVSTTSPVKGNRTKPARGAWGMTGEG